jgi:hypothetical protein
MDSFRDADKGQSKKKPKEQPGFYVFKGVLPYKKQIEKKWHCGDQKPISSEDNGIGSDGKLFGDDIMGTQYQSAIQQPDKRSDFLKAFCLHVFFRVRGK